MPITADKRGYSAGKSFLELDGVNGGSLMSAEGGDATSDVVVEKVGPDLLVRKHLAGVKYNDIEVQCGLGMSASFYQWIADTFTSHHGRKNGAIVSADYNGQAQSRLQFFNALITKVAFPALDAASKDAARLTAALAVERTQRQKGGGPTKLSDGGKLQQKKWLPSNFRLTIPGLDCTHVNRIEAFVATQKVVDNPVGEMRDYEKVAAHQEFGDLVVTLAESHADDWYTWHDDFVVKGNNDNSREKTGTLEFLSPNMQEVLFTLTFTGLGIFKLVPDKIEAGTENIRRVQASMYVEQAFFEAKSGAGATASAGTPTGTSTATTTPTSTPTSTPAAPTETGPVFLDDEPAPMVLVNGKNGPVVAEDIPPTFTRIRRTT